MRNPGTRGEARGSRVGDSPILFARIFAPSKAELASFHKTDFKPLFIGSLARSRHLGQGGNKIEKSLQLFVIFRLYRD